MKQRLSFWVALAFIATTLHAAKADVITTNNAGVSLSFSSSNSYEWEWNSYIGSNGGLRSTNYHLGSTASQTSITIEAQTDCIFIFDYTISSESGYDKLSISIDNNTFVDNISGSFSSSCTVQLSRGSHTMILKYVKDSSADSGDDRAYVSNFRFTSTQILDLDDGLPGRERPGSIIFESPLFTSETPLTYFRMTVLETEGNRPEYYSYYPYFNLSEFYLYDMNGNRIELTAENFFSNAKEPREGSYEGLCDGSLKTFFHSCWTTGVGEEHYLEVSFPEPMYSFSFAYEIINTYGRLLNAPIKISIMADDELTTSSSVINPSTALTHYECTYYATTGETVELLNSHSPFPSTMTVDGVEVTPSGTYVFDTDGLHTVNFLFPAFFLGEIPSFSLCTHLTSVTISEGVTSIGSSTFSGCSSLTSINIPSSVKCIGDYAFGNCSSLKSVTIPECVTSIEYGAFYGCTSLSSITIPNSVTCISERAFSDCYSLTSVVIPNSVLEIGNSAFEHCYSLSSLIIPEGVTNIGAYTFYTCSGLTSIAIPGSVMSIGEGAFRYTNVEKIYCLGSIPPAIGYDNFDNKTIYVPIGSKYDYSSANCWSNNSIVEYSSVNNFILSLVDDSYLIVEGYIGNESEASQQTIPSSAVWNATAYDVTKINDGAFKSSTMLTNVMIPNCIETIGDYAFSGCGNLFSVSLGEGISSIGTYAFSNCSNLTNITAYMAIPPIINRDVFSGIDMNACTLLVPESAKTIYQNTSVWNEFCPFSVNTTRLEELDYAVYAEPATGIVGKQVAVKLDLKNANAIATWQADLVLPEGFTVATDIYGDPMITVSGSRTTSARHSIATNTLEGGATRILYNSSSNKTISGTDGEVATLTLNIAEDVEPGDYPIIFKNLVLSEADQTGHKADQIVSKISVMSYTPGDVNNDGEINAQDLVAVVNFILEISIEGNIREAADLNEDGNIDVMDFVGEVSMILSANLSRANVPALRGVASAEENGDLEGTFGMNPFTLLPGERSEVAVSLQQTDGAYTCSQFDLVLPEGVRLVEAVTSLHSHSVAFRTLENGATRVLLFSASNKAMRDADSVLVLTLEADNDLLSGLYDLKLDRTMLVTASGERATPSSLNVSFTVGDATGIHTTEAATEFIRYNLAGQRTNASEQGVMIVNGKKRLIK